MTNWGLYLSNNLILVHLTIYIIVLFTLAFVSLRSHVFCSSDTFSNIERRRRQRQAILPHQKRKSPKTPQFFLSIFSTTKR
jgi:hypothetical protein